jgi:integrase/recombinase XerD
VFVAWCGQLGLSHPHELTLPLLERYRQVVYATRKADGEPLGIGSQVQKLLAIKQFLRWATRMHIVPANVAADLDLPRRPQHLPRAVLSAEEIERVLAQPDLVDPIGLRDRAMLETLYSTGMRRLELVHLAPGDVDVARGVVHIRDGKGGRDRVVPIGERALAWIEIYRRRARPNGSLAGDAEALFLTRRGKPIPANRLTELAHRYVSAARLRVTGSCHLFRHTMATLMLEGGADVRCVQAMLGHAQLNTTALYTRVSIRHLKSVHERAHPAGGPRPAFGEAHSGTAKPPGTGGVMPCVS